MKDVAVRQAKYSRYHVHAWNAVIEWLIKAEGVTEPQKKDIQQNIDHAKGRGGLKFFEEEVKVCGIAKAYEKTEKKLEISVVAGTKSEAIYQILRTVLTLPVQGGRSMAGQAPPGHFENAVQGWLEGRSTARKD